MAGNPGTQDGDDIQSGSCKFDLSDPDQIWSLDGHGRLISQASGKCAEVEGLGLILISDGANVRLHSCQDPTSVNDQMWYFQYQHGYIRIRKKYTDKCLDVTGFGSTVDGRSVRQWTCQAFDDPLTDHWWTMEYVNQ